MASWTNRLMLIPRRSAMSMVLLIPPLDGTTRKQGGLLPSLSRYDPPSNLSSVSIQKRSHARAGATSDDHGAVARPAAGGGGAGGADARLGRWSEHGALRLSVG